MKKPYLTQDERILYRLNTVIGGLAMLKFRWLLLGREFYKERVSVGIAILSTIGLLIFIIGVI